MLYDNLQLKLWTRISDGAVSLPRVPTRSGKTIQLGSPFLRTGSWQQRGTPIDNINVQAQYRML
jgi:hypothetical protein